MARLITVAGGTGSGKSTLAHSIAAELDAVVIRIDDYYHPLDHLSFEAREQVNFDAPEAIDHKSLICDVEKLLHGEEIEHPIYDFSRHTRSEFGRITRPKATIIVEGIFALYWPELNAMASCRLFINTPQDLRFARRLKRDVEERGRDLMEVTKRFTEHVNPMHQRYVEPTRVNATSVVPGDCDLAESIKLAIQAAIAERFSLL